MSTKSDNRAYINPQAALGEAEQKGLVAPYEPTATYIEGRAQTRAAWIASLRPTSTAIVPELFCLAKAAGRKDGRFADLLLAAGQVCRRGVVLVEASSGARSDGKKWDATLERAREMLGRAVKKGKPGKPRLGFTREEVKDMLAIRDSKKYRNWKERVAAMKKIGIRVPSRTWYHTKLDGVAREFGLI